MWDLATLKRINDREARRQLRLIQIREEMRRKGESETFMGRIAQSEAEAFDRAQEDKFDRDGVND